MDRELKGRGASENPANRFEEISYEREADGVSPDDEIPSPSTRFFRDRSKSVLTYNESPDLPFRIGLNPYRGCEHGCAYCYARPYHEYLGLSAGLDFETKILVKEDAPELLRKELSSPKWKPELISMSGITDCYQPAERKFEITRRCLEVFAEFLQPVGIITKNALVIRDIDLLRPLAEHQAASVFVSVTTLDPDLSRLMEPRASHPQRRLAAIEALSKAGIPVGVMAAPMIPGLTDHELPAILRAAAKAGARHAGYTVARLPLGVAQIFEHWLAAHRPGLQKKVMTQIRQTHEGRLNDSRHGRRLQGRGRIAETIDQIFDLTCRKEGLNLQDLRHSTASFRRPKSVSQLELF